MTALIIVLIFLLGYFIHRILSGDTVSIGDLGLFWPLGLGSLVVIYFVINFILEVKFDFRPLLIVLLGILFLASYLFSKSSLKTIDLPKFNRLTKLVLIIILIFISYPVIMLLYWPPYTPDAISLYDFRAQLLNQEGNFEFLNVFDPGTLAYPPLTSIVHHFFYLTGSSTPNWLYVISLVSLLLIVFDLAYYYSRSTLGSLAAVLGTLLTPVFYWTTFLSLSTSILGLFIASSIVCILKNRFLSAALLLGFSTFIRGEPFWVGAVVLLILSAVKNRSYRSIPAFLLIFYSLSAIWPSYTNSIRSYHPLRVIYTESRIVSQKSSISKALSAIHFSTPIFFSAWNILPLISLLTMFHSLLFNRKNILLHLVAPFLVLTIFSGFVLFSFNNPEWTDLNDSLFRLAILPVPFFWTSLVNSLIKFPNE